MVYIMNCLSVCNVCVILFVVKDLFAFAGSDNMASEVFSVQLAWSSNTILSTVDGSLSDHEISSPSTLYVLWMSGAQIEVSFTFKNIYIKKHVLTSVILFVI